MDTVPEKIYKNYIGKAINKYSAIEQLISLTENSDNMVVRIDCIKALEKIGVLEEKVFTFFENLLISDTNEIIRINAAKCIKNLFLNRALNPMTWALEHESSIKVLITAVKSLGEIKVSSSKSILIDEIYKIKNQKYKKCLSDLFKNKKIEYFNNEELAEILVNYLIVNYFEKKYDQVDFELINGLIKELTLYYFNINKSNVLKVVPEFINNLKALKKLDLKINKIKAIPASIDSLTSLIYLDLSYNKLKYLPDSICYLKSLKFLYLRYNDLISIPSSIGSLKSLKILDLRANKLKSLPSSITNMTSLKVLDVHGNHIEELPESIGSLTSLKKLDLGLNNLKNLPESMQNLKFLKLLGLGGNKLLKILPEWITSFSSLNELHLNDNNLENLPESIGSLIPLKILHLRNNQLKELPKSFKSLTSLKSLDLSWNNFSYLPDWIDSLVSLEEINLWGNRLDSLPKSIANLPSLKILNLHYNKFSNNLPNFLKNSKNLKDSWYHDKKSEIYRILNDNCIK